MPSPARPLSVSRTTGPVRFTIGESTLGATLVAMTDRGVCAILIGEHPEPLVAELRRRFLHAEAAEGDSRLEALCRRAIRLVEGGATDDLPLDPRGTGFERRVWDAIVAIPAGSVASYAELASRIGAPGSVRAVARACASNPIAVAIPCHRVVRSDGGLGGYRWGVTRKRALLAREVAA